MELHLVISNSIEENIGDLPAWMLTGGTTDLLGAPADLYNLYGQFRKGIGSPTLASLTAPELEKVIGLLLTFTIPE